MPRRWALIAGCVVVGLSPMSGASGPARSGTDLRPKPVAIPKAKVDAERQALLAQLAEAQKRAEAANAEADRKLAIVAALDRQYRELLLEWAKRQAAQ